MARSKKTPKKSTKKSSSAPAEEKVVKVDENELPAETKEETLLNENEENVEQKLDEEIIPEPAPVKPAPKKEAPKEENRYLPVIKMHLENFEEKYKILIKTDKILRARQHALFSAFDLMLRDKTRASFDFMLDYFKKNVAEDFLHETKALSGSNLLPVAESEFTNTLYVCFRSVTSVTKGDISLDVLRKITKNDDLVKYFSEFID